MLDSGFFNVYSYNVTKKGVYMNLSEALKELLRTQHVSQSELARRLNITRSAANQAINHFDMQVSTTVTYLNALGYDMVFIPKGKLLPKDSITIDNGYEFNNHELIG